MNRPLITVKTLLAQSQNGDTIELPANALITPAAADWLRTCRKPVQRVGVTNPEPNHTPAIYLIGDPSTPYLRTLLPGLEREHHSLTFLTCNGKRDGLLEAIHTMCDAIGEDKSCRGIIVVENGAISSCVANKHPAVRAAIVTQRSSLFGLQRELGINVLIIENGRTSLQQARATIDSFLSGKSRLDPVIAAALPGATSAEPSGEPDLCNCGS